MLDSRLDSWRIPLRLANAAQLGGVAAAAFGLAWLGFAVSAGPDARAEARRAAQGLSRAYAAAIDQDLNRVEADARTLALLLRPARPGPAEIDASALLRDWVRLKPAYRDAVLFSADGTVAAASEPRRRPASLRPQAALLRARNAQVAVMTSPDANLAERPFDLLVTFGAPGQSDGLALGVGPAFFDEIAERVRRASDAAGERAAFAVRGADGRLLAGAAIPEGEGASSPVRSAGPLASPGWTVTARFAPGALPPASGPPATTAALGLALALAAAGLGYALAHRIARRLERLAAAPAGPLDGAAGSRIRECDDLSRAVLDQIRSTACRLAGAETGLARVQGRLHSFTTMSGWTCWEIDPAAQRVVWADRAPAAPSRGERTADLAALRARIEPEDCALLDGAVAAAAAADGLHDVVLRLRATPDEPAHRILVRVLASPASREGARRLHVLSRALTEQDDAAPALPVVERRRNHVLRRVTDGVVHDVNDVLTVVLANLGTLKRRHPLDGEQARYVDTALAGALRGRALTRSMLAFVRNPTEAAAPLDAPEDGHAGYDLPDCDLPAVVASFVPFLQANVLHGTPVIDRVPARLPRLACGERILELVLLNIALHFRDLGLQGFAIAAAEQQAEGEEGLGLAPGLYVRVLIASGRPVPGAAPGAGRAPTTLATAGALVGRLRGGWRLRDDGSREGAFLAEIWLPALPGTAAAVPVLESGSLRVLLVEADSLLRESVAAALAALGHEVAQAASAEHALRLLDERADYDAMIVDQSLPVMGGLQLAATVVERHPRIRIVLASPRGQRPAPARAFLHLEKPFRPEDLAAVLRRADARVAA
ncbi:response regulator [Methylobacterium oryzisoli]|uniref:response regulator n=1 Tax=Methylobacterium oryzisoli TaxID=3385502 RepID=UPI003891B84D